ncbi:MAG: GntR family transcriptional regulator [Candidatus Eremiobacteraeota bacterium]|nr:GntR family transcriptional regulator [Candidatus Eremiobacteraeota bacterium]
MQTNELRLDERSPVPVYVQLRDQILHALARGTLKGGDRLPAVRTVASTLRVNPNTVNRAYAELERDGVLVVERGRGTYVAERARASRAPHKHRLVELAERFVAQARAMGFDGPDVIKAVTVAVRSMRGSWR